MSMSSGGLSAYQFDFIGINAPVIMDTDMDIPTPLESLPYGGLRHIQRFCSCALTTLCDVFAQGKFFHAPIINFWLSAVNSCKLITLQLTFGYE